MGKCASSFAYAQVFLKHSFSSQSQMQAEIAMECSVVQCVCVCVCCGSGGGFREGQTGIMSDSRHPATSDFD